MPSYKRACKWKTKTLIRIYASVSCILFDKPYHLSKESFTLAPSLALSPLPHRGNGVTELGFHLISMEKFDLNETTFLHDYMSVCKSHSPSTLKKKKRPNTILCLCFFSRILLILLGFSKSFTPHTIPHL